MTDLQRLEQKTAALGKMSRKEVLAKVHDLEATIQRAECLQVVTGAIPESILSAVDSALRILVPMVSFMGDFELSNLLGSLKIWLQKKRMEQQQEDQQRMNMQDLGNYW